MGFSITILSGVIAGIVGVATAVAAKQGGRIERGERPAACERDEAIRCACEGCSLKEIEDYFGLHYL